VTADKGEAPRNSGAKARRGRPFEPGNGGRRPGQRNRATLLIESLIEGEAEQLGRRLIAMALQGEPVAMKIIMDRLVPRRSGRPTPFKLPLIETVSDTPRATSAILRAVAEGKLTSEEGAAVMRIVEGHTNALNLVEVVQRLTASLAALEEEEV
jgi:hypothetical protein